MTALLYDGTMFVSPDMAPGTGVVLVPDPATRLAGMVNSMTYYQENGGDADCIVINCEGFLISMYKSFSNQKLMDPYVFRMTNVGGGENKIRLIQRGFATTSTLEQALKSVGEGVVLPDSYSGSMVTLNPILIGLCIQIFKL